MISVAARGKKRVKDGDTKSKEGQVYQKPASERLKVKRKRLLEETADRGKREGSVFACVRPRRVRMCGC